VLSMLCAIFSKLDPRETEHKNLMDELSVFCQERDLEPTHRARLRDFFNYTKDFAREGGYSAIFERMSNKLRADTALLMGQQHVQLVWYLQRDKCETGFLCEVALNLKPAVYEIHENMPIKKLTVISRGLVAQRMRLIGSGKVLGSDCILKENHWGLRDSDPVMCLSFVHVACISRGTLFELAAQYPMAERNLSESARHMTVRMSLIIYYRNFVRHNRRLPGRIGLEEATSAAYMKRIRPGSTGEGGFLPKKEMLHQGDSRQLDVQIDELKTMIATLAASQHGTVAKDTGHSRHVDQRKGSLRGGGGKARGRTDGRGDGRGERRNDARDDFRSESRMSRGASKDRPGRSSPVDFRRQSTSSPVEFRRQSTSSPVDSKGRCSPANVHERTRSSASARRSHSRSALEA